jgi:hypothetical protein
VQAAKNAAWILRAASFSTNQKGRKTSRAAVRRLYLARKKNACHL